MIQNEKLKMEDLLIGYQIIFYDNVRTSCAFETTSDIFRDHITEQKIK